VRLVEKKRLMCDVMSCELWGKKSHFWHGCASDGRHEVRVGRKSLRIGDVVNWWKKADAVVDQGKYDGGKRRERAR
jgi:hypothetical protein